MKVNVFELNSAESPCKDFWQDFLSYSFADVTKAENLILDSFGLYVMTSL